jgi:3-oxoacyl-(acyl-carrier-protein) synthase
MERLMTEVFVRGIGAVSPAGWGVSHLRDALAVARPLPPHALERPGWQKQLRARQVPPPPARPAFLGHARLRRTSPISHYAVGAALEALGEDAAKIASGSARMGIVLCVMSGCVNYSRRFYDETLRDPATASPLLFPETVFNAPGSHLAALLGTTALNYTLVGDPGTFLQGLAVAAEWLGQGELDGCLVVGAEELDWLTADAYRLFSRGIILSEGAGAVYLGLQPAGKSAVKLGEITDSHLFHGRISQIRAALRMRSQLSGGGAGDLLCDSRTGLPGLDRGETKAWNSWPGMRVSPKMVLGEGLMAAAAWQTVAAVDAIRQGRCSQALVSVVGCNQQVIGARFSA